MKRARSWKANSIITFLMAGSASSFGMNKHMQLVGSEKDNIMGIGNVSILRTARSILKGR